MSIFLKIINREIPANIVYEDEFVIAFLDISQLTKGHTLVVPKKRYENIFELNDKIAAHLSKAVINIAKALKKAFQPDGLNIVNNNGKAAGQEVFHYHVHLIPRYSGDDFILKGVNHGNEYDLDDFKTLKEEIIKALL